MGDSSEKAFKHLKKIREAVEKLHIRQNSSVSEWVTVSVGGVTLVPQTENSYEFYLKLADAMLYDAKKFGRNMVVWADENMKQWREK